MKRYLLGVASILALTAGAASAQTVPNGYIGLGYNYSDTTTKTTVPFSEEESLVHSDAVAIDADQYNDHAITQSINVDGAVALPVTSLIGVQVDLHYGNIQDNVHETENDGGDLYHNHFGDHADGTAATGHVFARTSQGLIGGFVGEESYGQGIALGGGVEGQYYAGPFTLQAAAGGAKEMNEFGEDLTPTIWAVRGDVRYFVTPDLSLGVNAGYLDGSASHDFGEGDRVSESGPALWTVGVGAEFKIPGSPFAVLANYEHGAWSGNVNANDEEFDHANISGNGDSVSVGVRWTFGGSLVNRDHHGASLPSFKQVFGDNFGAVAASDLVDF